MKAIMLAAGTGSRLAPKNKNLPPKCLLRFDGKSLLCRHIEILKSFGVEKLILVVGYQANEINAEIMEINEENFVKTIMNPNYYDGSIISLSCAKSAMQSGSNILFMDADVLYHPDLIKKLVSSSKDCHILYDRNYVPGDDPVLLCLKNKNIVDFQKRANIECDDIGEWPGFVKWSPSAAMEISKIIDHRISHGLTTQPCEDSFREYMLNVRPQNIYCDDISGIPWIEIDFPEDISRAQNSILGAINNYTR
jgi:choline kinase